MTRSIDDTTARIALTDEQCRRVASLLASVTAAAPKEDPPMTDPDYVGPPPEQLAAELRLLRSATTPAERRRGLRELAKLQAKWDAADARELAERRARGDLDHYDEEDES